eukprot:scaffold31771_cov129-Isochrysis_galbana.AAC.6
MSTSRITREAGPNWTFSCLDEAIPLRRLDSHEDEPELSAKLIVNKPERDREGLVEVAGPPYLSVGARGSREATSTVGTIIMISRARWSVYRLRQ